MIQMSIAKQVKRNTAIKCMHGTESFGFSSMYRPFLLIIRVVCPALHVGFQKLWYVCRHSMRMAWQMARCQSWSLQSQRRHLRILKRSQWFWVQEVMACLQSSQDHSLKLRVLSPNLYSQLTLYLTCRKSLTQKQCYRQSVRSKWKFQEFDILAYLLTPAKMLRWNNHCTCNNVSCDMVNCNPQASVRAYVCDARNRSCCVRVMCSAIGNVVWWIETIVSEKRTAGFTSSHSLVSSP